MPGIEGGAVVASIVALSLILAKLLEKLVSKYIDRDKDGDGKITAADLTAACSENGCKVDSFKIEKIYDVLSKCDVDGTPLCYVPRSWIDTQKEVVKALLVISETQKDCLRSLNSLADTQKESLRIIDEIETRFKS